MKRLVGTSLFVCVSPSLCSVSPSPPPQGPECVGMSFRLRAFRSTTKCNFTTLKEKHVKEIQAPTTNTYSPISYSSAFSVGSPSNLSASWVLVFRTKHSPSTTSLINSTVVDCLLFSVSPFRIVYHFRGNHWDSGEPFCRVVMAMFYGNMYSSVWCLAFVASDRYVALVHPFGAKTFRSRRISSYMSGTVWGVMSGAMSPSSMSQQTYRSDDPNITTCHDASPENEQDAFFSPYFGTSFATCFSSPFVIVMFCHCAISRTSSAEGQRYGHAVRVTVSVMLVFIVCSSPSNVLSLSTYSDTSDGDGDDLYVPYMISSALSTFNSCIDPFIFYFVSKEFRQKAKSTSCCVSRKKDMSSQGTHTSSSAGQSSKVTSSSMTSRQGTSDSATRGQQDNVTVT